MKKEVIKKSKGITLIALVVTIVVLLILAGVSISMLTGENGIITQAQEAKTGTEIGNEREQVKLAYTSASTKKITNGDNSEVTADDINEELNIQRSDATASGEGIITVKFNKSGREYDITVDGNILEVPSIDMVNIFKYDPSTGYITGIKDEYIYKVSGKRTNEKANEIKIASVGDNFKIATWAPPVYRIDERLKGYLKIPEIIEGTRIIGIADGAFYSIKNLYNIKIPNSITSIGNYAFEYSGSLERISIPESVTSIGEAAFDGCSSLVSINIPNNVTEIKDSTFSRCWNLKNIIIPESVTSIGDRAFAQCASLINITIPENVTSMGSDAFWNCNNLLNINIKKTENSILGAPWGADTSTTNINWNYTGE